MDLDDFEATRKRERAEVFAATATPVAVDEAVEPAEEAEEDEAAWTVALAAARARDREPALTARREIDAAPATVVAAAPEPAAPLSVNIEISAPAVDLAAPEADAHTVVDMAAPAVDVAAAP